MHRVYILLIAISLVFRFLELCLSHAVIVSPSHSLSSRDNCPFIAASHCRGLLFFFVAAATLCCHVSCRISSLLLLLLHRRMYVCVCIAFFIVSINCADASSFGFGFGFALPQCQLLSVHVCPPSPSPSPSPSISLMASHHHPPDSHNIVNLVVRARNLPAQPTGKKEATVCGGGAGGVLWSWTRIVVAISFVY